MLVGYESYSQVPSLALPCYHLPQDASPADAHRVEALAQFKEKAIEPFVLEWMIHLPLHSITMPLAVEPQRYRGHPFPIAIMGGIEYYALAGIEGFVDNLGILEHHALAHRLIADVKQLDCLNKIVGKVAVKLLFYCFSLLVALAGKALHQVLAHHVLAIAYEVICNEINNVGMQVKYPPWHQCQQVQGPSNGSVQYFAIPLHVMNCGLLIQLMVQAARSIPC